jgi:predicted CoA-binding protein
MNKPTVVIGASNNPERYAFKATQLLSQHGHTVYPVGLREGKINDIDIITQKKSFNQVDTVTLYVGPANQPAWYDYILSLNPKRIIFNPGTENPELVNLASAKHIECTEACTLVLLSINNY